MEKVSAIITTHNRSELLKRAIESVLNQTYKNMECIVVDDNSTDNTREVCSQYPIQYIYIPKEESHGGNYARNLGIKASTGKYCAFLDDDDYWLPEKTEKQVKLIEEKGCGLVFCGRRLEIINNQNISYKDILPDPLYMGNMSRKILYQICTVTSCLMIRKELLNDEGMFDEKLNFWQEYELTIRLAQITDFYYVNEPLCVYRINNKDKQKLTNKYKEWKTAVQYVYKKHRMLYKSLSIFDAARVKIRFLFGAYTRCYTSGKYIEFLYYYISWTIISVPFRAIDKFKRWRHV